MEGLLSRALYWASNIQLATLYKVHIFWEGIWRNLTKFPNLKLLISVNLVCEISLYVFCLLRIYELQFTLNLLLKVFFRSFVPTFVHNNISSGSYQKMIALFLVQNFHGFKKLFYIFQRPNKFRKWKRCSAFGSKYL